MTNQPDYDRVADYKRTVAPLVNQLSDQCIALGLMARIDVLVSSQASTKSTRIECRTVHPKDTSWLPEGWEA